MLEPVFNFFDQLITKFTWGRLAFAIMIVFAALCSVLVYESYTGHFRLQRIERSTKLAKDLAEIATTISTTNNRKLAQAYEGACEDLREYVCDKPIAFNMPNWLLRSIAAAFPWILFGIIARIADPSDYKKTLAGISILLIPAIATCIYIPDLNSPWINYLLIPFGLFFIGVAFALWYSKRQKG